MSKAQKKLEFRDLKAKQAEDALHLERLGIVNFINQGVREFAQSLCENIGPMKKDDVVYFKAVLKRAIESPDDFRHNGYFDGQMHFINHQRDKRGKLISVDALFPSEHRALKKVNEALTIIEQLGMKND